MCLEQAQEQVYKKTFRWPTVQESILPNVFITGESCLPDVLPRNNIRFLKYSRSYLYSQPIPWTRIHWESIRIPKLDNCSNISNLQSIFRMTYPLKIVVYSLKSVIRLLSAQNDSLVMNTPGSLNSPVMNTRGVLTPSGQYIGESWPPVVNFLVYFEQASEQVHKKVCGDKRPGSQNSPIY